MKGSNLTWDVATLDAYLSDPAEVGARQQDAVSWA